MTKETLFALLSDLDNTLIVEAEEPVPQKTKLLTPARLRVFTTAAACVCILALGGGFLLRMAHGNAPVLLGQTPPVLPAESAYGTSDPYTDIQSAEAAENENDGEASAYLFRETGGTDTAEVIMMSPAEEDAVPTAPEAPAPEMILKEKSIAAAPKEDAVPSADLAEAVCAEEDEVVEEACEEPAEIFEGPVAEEAAAVPETADTAANGGKPDLPFPVSVLYEGTLYSRGTVFTDFAVTDALTGTISAFDYDGAEPRPLENVYAIDGIDPTFACAVLVPEGVYVTYFRSDYVPETWGQFMKDFSLETVLAVSGTAHESRTEDGVFVSVEYSGVPSDAVWDILRTCGDAPCTAEDVGGGLRISVDLPLFGFHNRMLCVQEDGYLTVNLFGGAKRFHVGTEVTDRLRALIENTCEKAEQRIQPNGDEEPIEDAVLPDEFFRADITNGEEEPFVGTYPAFPSAGEGEPEPYPVEE